MKSYDETIETVFKRIEEYEATQKKKQRFVFPTSASQCNDSSQSDEPILKVGHKIKQDNRSMMEENEYQATEILPLKKKNRKNHFAQKVVRAGISLAACAAILLIIWIPAKLSNSAGSTDSTASTVFEESVAQTDMVLWESEESCQSDEVTESTVANVNYFTEMFGEAVAIYAFTPDFSDSDGHVVVRAEQMLSDGANTYLVVSYEYLDERGKAWLNDYFSDLSSNEASILLSMRPEMKDTSIFGFSWSSSCATAKNAGLQQYETSTKKYFLVSYSCSTNRYNTDFVKLEYPMPGVLKSATIEMTEYLPGTVYEITAELQENRSYLPVRVTINPLGILLEGSD